MVAHALLTAGSDDEIFTISDVLLENGRLCGNVGWMAQLT